MKKISRLFKVIMISLLVACMSLGCVCAQDDAIQEDAAVSCDSPANVSIDDSMKLEDVVLNESSKTDSVLKASDADVVGDDTPESPDLIINLTNDNLGNYFKRGILRTDYNYATFSLCEDLEDIGPLIIRANNVTILGNNHTLTNTVFSIEANGVSLSNFTMNETMEFEDNEYAAILIYMANDARISDVNIDYDVPQSTEAYGIYSLGTNRWLNQNLIIANCTINFKGHNAGGGRDYAVRLEYSRNATFSNNTVNAELPLRTVDFTGTTAFLYSEFSLAVGIANCDNLTFSGNTVNCSVNKRPECAYPTLDSVFICDSKNCSFTNNYMYLTDKITYKDEANYLYALDIYRNENMLVENNTIRVVTRGGAYAAGTAYPIQLTGPAGGVVIKGNDLYSKSNGPNLGIYSQNFNGENFITIVNNHINVTGRAGNHSWALVAGIEVQDDNDTIMNNLIEVHNTEKTTKDDNLYGISYSQETNSTHSYRVINNTVISDGYYLSYMLDAENTTVTNNTLVRSDKYADTDYDPFKRGSAIGNDTDASKNNDFSGNRVITIFEHELEHQSNEIDGGEEFNYEPPTNENGISNTINGSGIAPDSPSFPSHNPLIPGGNTIPSDSNNPGSGTSFGPDVPDGDSSFKDVPGLVDDDGRSLSRKHESDNGNGARSYWNVQSNDDGSSNQNSYSDGRSSDVSYSKLVRYENSSSSVSPSTNGATSSGSNSEASTSAGAGLAGASKSTSRAYEVIKKIEDDPDSIVKFVGLAIICEILLIIGYKRKEKDEI